MRVIEFDAKDVSALAFSADGRYLAVGGKTRLIVIYDLSGTDPETPGIVSEFHPQLAFHPRLPLVFAAAERRFATHTHKPGRLSQAIDFMTGADRFALSPDGTRVVVSGGFDTPEKGEHLRVFDVSAAGRLLYQRTDPAARSDDRHDALCWLPGTDRVAVSGRNRSDTHISVRDVATGAVVATHPRSGLVTDRLTAGPDGTLVAVYRHSFSVWPDADIGRRPHVVKNDSTRHFTGIAFHPSGKHLAATSNDATVKLFDTATWEIGRAFTWDVGKMRSVAFSPDGTLAAAGSDTGKVMVWDVDV
jgi:WD40 repeat protein